MSALAFVLAQALPAATPPPPPPPERPLAAGLARATGALLGGGAHLAAAGTLLWTAREIEVEPLFWLGVGVGLFYPFTAVFSGDWLAHGVEADPGADVAASRWALTAGYLTLIVAGPVCGSLIDDDVGSLVCLGGSAAGVTALSAFLGHQQGSGDPVKPPPPRAPLGRGAGHRGGVARAPATSFPLWRARF